MSERLEDIAAAMMKARLCPELRQEQFLERFQLQSQGASSSSSGHAPHSHNHQSRKAKGTAKESKKRPCGGKAKGGTKGKDKKVANKNKKGAKASGKGPRLATSHNGKQICFAFHEKKCAGGCGRENIGQHGFEKHMNADCKA